jgi:hypothetical protein
VAYMLCLRGFTDESKDVALATVNSGVGIDWHRLQHGQYRPGRQSVVLRAAQPPHGEKWSVLISIAWTRAMRTKLDHLCPTCRCHGLVGQCYHDDGRGMMAR